VDFEKRVVVEAPIAKVWDLLLDPQVMAGCVPGTESVEVLSDTEYLATVKVKISFISARFTTRTTVLETRPPFYLKSEGTGEDSKVGSSLKQSSELTLAELPDERTEVTMKIRVEVFGRLGSFGLTVMKTKADRMWEEFGANLNARARAGKSATIDVSAAEGSASEGTEASREPIGNSSTLHAAPATLPLERPSPTHTPTARGAAKGSWWTRLMPGARVNNDLQDLQRLSTDIYIEVQKENSTVRVLWPAHGSRECVAWLKDYLK